ncbi:MAG: hypothetical protein LKM30_04290 [Bacilli bacterium]|jgi:hypothetical protein|nr:hypothetical protein [Bacilli bacterium]
MLDPCKRRLYLIRIKTLNQSYAHKKASLKKAMHVRRLGPYLYVFKGMSKEERANFGKPKIDT